jgi:hypothetical protein
MNEEDLDTEDFQKLDERSLKDYVKRLDRRLSAIEGTLLERRKPISFNILTGFAVLAFMGLPFFWTSWSYSLKDGKAEVSVTSKGDLNSDFVKHLLPPGVGGTLVLLAILSLTKPGDKISDIVYNLLVKR